MQVENTSYISLHALSSTLKIDNWNYTDIGSKGVGVMETDSYRPRYTVELFPYVSQLLKDILH